MKTKTQTRKPRRTVSIKFGLTLTMFVMVGAGEVAWLFAGHGLDLLAKLFGAR